MHWIRAQLSLVPSLPRVIAQSRQGTRLGTTMHL